MGSPGPSAAAYSLSDNLKIMTIAPAPGFFRLRLLDEQPFLSSSGKDVVKVSCDDGHIYIHRCLLLSDSKMFRDRSVYGESASGYSLILNDTKVSIAEQMLRLLYQGFTVIHQEVHEDVKKLIEYFGLRNPENETPDEEVFESNAPLTYYKFNEDGKTISFTDSIDIDTAQISSFMMLEYDDIIKENFQTAHRLNEVYVPVLEPVTNVRPTKVTTITVTVKPMEVSDKPTPTRQIQSEPARKDASAQSVSTNNISKQTLNAALMSATVPKRRESATSSDAQSTSFSSFDTSASSSTSINQAEDNRPLMETVPEFIKVGPERKLSKVTRVESRQGSSIKRPNNEVLDKRATRGRAAAKAKATAEVSGESQATETAGFREELEKLPEFRKVPPASRPTRAPRKATAAPPEPKATTAGFREELEDLPEFRKVPAKSFPTRAPRSRKAKANPRKAAPLTKAPGPSSSKK